MLNVQKLAMWHVHKKGKKESLHIFVIHQKNKDNEDSVTNP